MKGLIQRVSAASVTVDGQKVAQINRGILLLVGFEREDTHTNQDKLIKKVLNYRIFSDEQGRMNHSLKDVSGELLIVSQFTLVANTQKGNRPGFSIGASPQQGAVMFEQFVGAAKQQYSKVEQGIFGADMQVDLTNDGPVTFWFET
jgi:D-tyrosyl-tRNA(Tyr) deacylase